MTVELAMLHVEPTADELAEGRRLRRKKKLTNLAIDVFLLTVSILAAAIPARRAARVDPATTLRVD